MTHDEVAERIVKDVFEACTMYAGKIPRTPAGEAYVRATYRTACDKINFELRANYSVELYFNGRQVEAILLHDGKIVDLTQRHEAGI